MTRKRIVLVAGAVILLAAAFVYSRFRAGDDFVSRSTANEHWAVHCTTSGFVDISYEFRVHHFWARPIGPIYIADLMWEDLHYPADLFWSRDGTVAAATITHKDHPEPVFAAAYDFSTHQAIRSGSAGSPRDGSKDGEIRQLLERRGGSISTPLPSFKDI